MPIFVAPPPQPAFNWPAQAAETKSDSAHTHSVVGGAVTAPPKASALAAVGALTLVGVAVVVSVVGWRMVHAPHATGAQSPASAVSMAPVESAPLPLPPVVTVPAPTIAPPALDDPGANSVTPSPAIVPSSRAGVHKPGGLPAFVPVRPSATAAPPPQAVQPTATPKAPERPGPGF
jgi:hypothetical protein